MSNCCIGLCVKNSEEGLIQVLGNVDKIQSSFNEVKIIVAYDNSTDASLKILTDYSIKHDNMIIIQVNNKDDYVDKYKRHVDRSQRIANARNLILDHIYQFCSNWTYFIMMDTNDYSCISPIDTNVLNICLKSLEWDGLSFNREPYYDIWALSMPPLVLSCWHFYKHDRSLDIFRKHLSMQLNKIRPNEFLPVISAFGGFAIYRTKKFTDCRYTGKFRLDMFSEASIRKHAGIVDSKICLRANDCEHRSFHVDAIRKNSARIMISPLQIFPHAKDYKHHPA